MQIFGSNTIGSLYTLKCVKYCVEMATNLAINPKLLDEALKAGGQKTKKATVEEALKEYISRRKQLKITSFLETSIMTKATITKNNGRKNERSCRYFHLVPCVQAIKQTPIPSPCA